MDLFVSGYDDVTFDPDPLNPENSVINTHCRWRDDLENSVVPETYIPDPPCIMPFEEDDKVLQDEVQDENASVQSYWKNFAGWLDKWPGLAENRKAQQQFSTLWMNRPSDSRVRGFVVSTGNSIGVRHRPTMDEDQKTGLVLRPGQCFGVETIQEVDGNRFLKLPGPGAGWVFEKKDGSAIVTEMKGVEAGMFWYKCTADHPIEVRKFPSIDDTARAGFLLSPKEIVVVNVRVKIAGLWFYHLFDGRGWAFELKPGTLKNDRTPETTVMVQCDDDFIAGGELAVLSELVPPTHEVVEVGLWTYMTNMEPVLAIGGRKNGYFLAPGSIVKVDKRANSNGNPHRAGNVKIQNRVWLRLGDGNGWIPETDEIGKKLMLLQNSDQVAYPSWFRPGAGVDINATHRAGHADAWMTGVV